MCDELIARNCVLYPDIVGKRPDIPASDALIELFWYVHFEGLHEEAFIKMTQDMEMEGAVSKGPGEKMALEFGSEIMAALGSSSAAGESTENPTKIAQKKELGVALGELTILKTPHLISFHLFFHTLVLYPSTYLIQ